MRPVLAALAALAMLAVAAPAAQAKQYTHHDGVGDMHELQDQQPVRDAPESSAGDITRVQIRNDRRFVRLYMSFRDLGTADGGIRVYFNVQNGHHAVRHVFVGISPTSVTAPKVTNGAYQVVTCRGVRRSALNPSSRTVAVKVPRACFGKAKVVRLNANAEAGTNVDPTTTYVDDALTPGNPSAPYNYQSPVVWTPWVKRG